MRDAIDFSKLERLTPREDSWEKVCARLDAKEATTAKKSAIAQFLPFRTAISLAASLVLIAASVVLTISNRLGNDSVAISQITSAELSGWYSDLGANESDDFEELDKSETLSYLLEEAQ